MEGEAAIDFHFHHKSVKRLLYLLIVHEIEEYVIMYVCYIPSYNSQNISVLHRQEIYETFHYSLYVRRVDQEVMRRTLDRNKLSMRNHGLNFLAVLERNDSVLSALGDESRIRACKTST